MNEGDRVTVRAPDHAHDGREGTIVRVCGDDEHSPHVEVHRDPEIGSQPGWPIRHHGTFEEAKRDKRREDTELIEGSAGEKFAEVAFEGLVYKYAFAQLEQVQ